MKMKKPSPDFLGDILEGAVDGIAILAGGKIIFHNRRLEEMTGYSAKELEGMPINRLVSEKHLSLLSPAFDKSAHHTFPFHLEVKLFTKAGKELECELWVCSCKENQGKSIFYFRDITFWKEIEKSQIDILGKVSHEILSPLATIKETISIIREKGSGKLEDYLLRFLSLAEEEVIRLERITRNLIDVTRIVRGKVFPKPDEVKIKDIVKKAISSLSFLLQKKRIYVVEEIPNFLPSFLADPDQLTSVLINLLENAIKFSPEGEKVIIRVQLLDQGDKNILGRRLPPTEKYLMVSVIDFGPGIVEEDKDKIFEMFERGRAREGTKGIGIGLTIVKEFIHLHKGEIWVESKKGSGATFNFVIPLVNPSSAKRDFAKGELGKENEY